MFREEIAAVTNCATTKLKLLKTNPAGYFLMSMFGGIFIGLGVLLSFTIGGQLQGSPYVKLMMGIFFSAALSLIIIAGGELFTGNNVVMATGVLKRVVTVQDALKLWIVCWGGNLLGSVLLSYLYNFTGLYKDATLTAIVGSAAMKMSLPPLALFMRGLLCNYLVCLAVWCCFRSKSDSGKLIMVFWCIVIFFTAGFEHSVANMTILALALINNAGNETISLAGFAYNLLTVTLGNIFGGALFVAVPYFIAAKEMEK